jgi:hypothetical protein
MLVSSTLTNSFSNKSLWCCGEAINAFNSFAHWFVFWFQVDGCDGKLVKDWFWKPIHESWKTTVA